MRSRQLLSCLGLFLTGFGSAQDYVETWRDSTAGLGDEKVVWRQVRCAANDDVVVAGDATASGVRQLIVKRYSAAGAERWFSRDLSGNESGFKFVDAQVDGAGNVYTLHLQEDTNKINIVSFVGSTGALRWRKIIDIAGDPLAPSVDRAFLQVATKGNSTFVYVVRNFRGLFFSFTLNRLNPASGVDMFEKSTFSNVEIFAQSAAIDGVGNLLISLIDAQGAKVQKRSQGLQPVWERLLGGRRKIVVNVDPATGDVAALVEGAKDTSLARLNPTSGAIIKESRLFSVTAIRSLDFLLPGASGSWYACGNFRSAMTRGHQQISTPGAGSVPSAAMDRSGTLHTASGFSFAVRNYPRNAQFHPLETGNSTAVATDSTERVVLVGFVGDEGVVVQASQSFLTGTDVFSRPFTSQLNVEAPGVLANDLATFGSVLSLVTLPTNGTVTLNQDGSFTYTPSTTFTGNDQFQYRLTKGATSRTATCFVKRLRLTDFTVSPSTVIGESLAKVTLTVSTSTFVEDFRIPVTSSNPNAAFFDIFLKAGTARTTASGGTLKTTTTQNATLTVTLGGDTLTTTITFTPGGFDRFSSLFDAPIIAGESARLKLHLTGPAPATRTFELSYSPTSSIVGPETVTIPAGASSINFDVEVSSTSEPFVDVSVRLPRLLFSQVLSVKPPPVLAEFEFVDSTLYAGVSQRVRATLNSNSGSSGSTVNMSDNLATVTTPAALFVPANANAGTATFAAELTAANQTLTMTASRGAVSLSISRLIRPNLLERFRISPITAPVGGGVTGTIDLNWLAPAEGQVVLIKSTTPDLVGIPTSVTFNAGQTTRSFAIVGLRAGTAKVTVSIGKKSLTSSFTITQ